LSYY